MIWGSLAVNLMIIISPFLWLGVDRLKKLISQLFQKGITPETFTIRVDDQDIIIPISDTIQETKL